MCELGQVSRAGFYRFDPDRELFDADLDLRDEIQRIALEFPAYGRPRITAELKRRGWEAGHRRVGRIMREDNLLCLRRGKFVVATTDSRHNFRVYPNRAGSMKLTGIDQLWIADIRSSPLCRSTPSRIAISSWFIVPAPGRCRHVSEAPPGTVNFGKRRMRNRRVETSGVGRSRILEKRKMTAFEP